MGVFLSKKGGGTKKTKTNIQWPVAHRMDRSTKRNAGSYPSTREIDDVLMFLFIWLMVA